jgi:hypothetical protein
MHWYTHWKMITAGAAAFAGFILAVNQAWPIVGWYSPNVINEKWSSHEGGIHAGAASRRDVDRALCITVKQERKQLKRAIIRLPDDISQSTRQLYDEQLQDADEAYQVWDCATALNPKS